MDQATLVGAFVAGAVTSVHCVGMCGPLVCGICSLARDENERVTVATLYHAGRLVSYAIVGTLCGALGSQPLKYFFDSPLKVLPWFLVAVLLLHACLGHLKLPIPLLFTKMIARLRFKFLKMGPCFSALGAGLMTPLLPCTPLYLFFAALLLSSSALRGMECALAFCVGTIPLLWILGTRYQWLMAKMRLNQQQMNWMKRSLSLVTACVLAWRLQGTLHEAVTADEMPTCGCSMNKQ
ncbi:MAG: sulfite exporter TauE/SafE family protein [Akkermansiaceae bacterium]